MIGVDFGGTHIKAGIVERDGTLVRSGLIDTHAGAPPDQLFDAIAEVVRSLDEKPESVGLAIPGEVDPGGRCWRLPNVPGFEGVCIAEQLQQRLGCPVSVENDATTAALGELLFGHGRQHPSFLLVTLGTGIGGGLAITGQLRRGAHGFSGEIGHIRIDTAEDAWPCACGKRGCMESYAGTLGLIRRYGELGHEADNIHVIADAAHAGQAAARNVFAGMGRALGTGLAQLQNVLDLDALVFSGGISGSFDLIQPSLREALEANAFAPPPAQVPLLVSTVGEHAGVIGAAHLPGLDRA